MEQISTIFVDNAGLKFTLRPDPLPAIKTKQTVIRRLWAIIVRSRDSGGCLKSCPDYLGTLTLRHNY